MPIGAPVHRYARRQRQGRVQRIAAQGAVERQDGAGYRTIARRARLHQKGTAQYFAAHIGTRHLRPIDLRIAGELRGGQLRARPIERHAVQVRLYQCVPAIEFFEGQKEIHIRLHRALGLDRGEGMLRQSIQRGRAQVAERVRRIAARGHVNLQFRGLEIDETRGALVHREIADAAALQQHVQSFIAKFGHQGEILRARPALLVVQRQSIDARAREERAAAVAKRKMPYGTLDDHIGVRQMTHGERTIQPRERRRRDPRARQVQPHIRHIAVVHRSGQRQHGRIAVRRLMPRHPAAQRRIARAHLDRRSRDQKFVRRPLPEQRGLETLHIDRLRKLRRPCEHGLRRLDIDSSAALVPGQRAVQPSQTGRTTGGGESDTAKTRLHLELPRVACAGPPQIHMGIHPLAGRRNFLQPLAQVLLRKETAQRQQSLGAQIAGAHPQLEQP